MGDVDDDILSLSNLFVWGEREKERGGSNEINMTKAEGFVTRETHAV